MRYFALLLLVFLFTLSSAAQDEPVAATLIDDFDAGYEDGFASQWWTYSDDTGTTFGAALDEEMVFSGTTAMRLDVALVAAGYAGTGFDFNFPRDWEAGDGVVLRLRASEENVPVVIVLHLEDETQTSTDSPGVTPFGCEFMTPAGSIEDWTLVTLPWECFERLTWLGTEGRTDFGPSPVVSFEVAFEAPAEGEPFNGSIWVDDIRVISETDLNTLPSFEDIFADLPAIRANQVGYHPDDQKWFVATIETATYTLVDDATGEEVFSGDVEFWGFDEDAQQDIYRGNFEAFTDPGTYRIVLDTGDESYPFSIGDEAYVAPLTLAARALYLQRSGIAIDDAGNSGVTLEAGHLAPAVLWDDPNGEPLDVSGGWYDAGDFGRYIPTAAFAVNQLLYGFSANPDLWVDDALLDIPESGNGFPDLLDEIRWELDWMLRMQAEDGGVHHKVTTRSFPGFGTLPVEDTSQMFVFAVSSADTAYFAAVTAQASRVYAAYDAAYADTLLVASERAWAWLARNPEQVPAGGFQNPPVSEYPMQGGYDFVGVEDVPRMWAAAELLATTGNSEYDTAFAAYFAETTPDGKHTMNWANVYPMALYAYLSAEAANTETREAVADTFQQQAQAILDVTEMSGYGVALTDQVPGFEYQWGSNQIALAHGLYLMLADEFAPDSRFREAALAQVQYVLGINPLAKAYISGIGSDPVLYPHHNVSFNRQEAVPGFVTEGSNSQNAGGDAVVEGLWEMQAPAAMRYSDDWESWASNEPTIDANATFVALLAYWASPER